MDRGAFLPNLLIVLLSWAVIIWAITDAWPETPPPAPTLATCVMSGHVETPQGPVFCVLVANREER